MKKLIYSSSTLIVAIFLFSACSLKEYNSETMYKKGAYLTHLTKKAQVAIRKGIVQDKEIYAYVETKFPRALEPFSEYSIFMKNDQGKAVVLMCDKDAKKALLEDVACTGALDANDYFEKEMVCDFHLNIKLFCNLKDIN